MPNKIPRGGGRGAGGLGDGKKYGLSYCKLPFNMKLHITGLWYTFPNQNMEFHNTKILKEIMVVKFTSYTPTVKNATL